MGKTSHNSLAKTCREMKPFGFLGSKQQNQTYGSTILPGRLEKQARKMERDVRRLGQSDPQTRHFHRTGGGGHAAVSARQEQGQLYSTTRVAPEIRCWYNHLWSKRSVLLSTENPIVSYSPNTGGGSTAMQPNKQTSKQDDKYALPGMTRM